MRLAVACGHFNWRPPRPRFRPRTLRVFVRVLRVFVPHFCTLLYLSPGRAASGKFRPRGFLENPSLREKSLRAKSYAAASSSSSSFRRNSSFFRGLNRSTIFATPFFFVFLSAPRGARRSFSAKAIAEEEEEEGAGAIWTSFPIYKGQTPVRYPPERILPIFHWRAAAAAAVQNAARIAATGREFPPVVIWLIRRARALAQKQTFCEFGPNFTAL